jgi:hypothetical protein
MAGRSTGASTTWHAAGADFEPAFRVMADARKHGKSFEVAWPIALAACDPDARRTLLETAKAWRLEFEGRRSWGGDLVGALAVLYSDSGHRGDRAIA